MTLQEPDDERVIFRGEKQVVLNCAISVMIVGKMMKKGVSSVCDGYGERNYWCSTGLPLKRKVEVSIDVVPDMSPIT